MFEKIKEKCEKEQLLRIRNAVHLIKCCKEDYTCLRKYLSSKDYKKVMKLLEEYYLSNIEYVINNINKTNIDSTEYKNINFNIENITNPTPFTVLGIEEGNTSKEQLLEVINKKIIKTKETIYNEDDLNDQIDFILDAYNAVLKKQL